MELLSSIFQMENIYSFFQSFCSAYQGLEWFVGAYFICISLFFIAGREDLNQGFVYPFFLLLFTVFNPLFIIPFSRQIGLYVRIRRLFWLLPVNLVLAYSFTCISMFPKRKKWLRLPLAALCIVFVMHFGTSVKPYLIMPENVYKVKNYIPALSELLEEDSEKNGCSKAALYSSQRLLELRQYDPSIRSVLRRTDLLTWEISDLSESAVNQVIESGHVLHTLGLVSRYGVRIEKSVFFNCMKRMDADYVITSSDMELDSYFTQMGLEKIASVADFDVYRMPLSNTES